MTASSDDRLAPATLVILADGPRLDATTRPIHAEICGQVAEALDHARTTPDPATKAQVAAVLTVYRDEINARIPMARMKAPWLLTWCNIMIAMYSHKPCREHKIQAACLGLWSAARCPTEPLPDRKANYVAAATLLALEAEHPLLSAWGWALMRTINAEEVFAGDINDLNRWYTILDGANTYTDPLRTRPDRDLTNLADGLIRWIMRARKAKGVWSLPNNKLLHIPKSELLKRGYRTWECGLPNSPRGDVPNGLETLVLLWHVADHALLHDDAMTDPEITEALRAIQGDAAATATRYGAALISKAFV